MHSGRLAAYYVSAPCAAQDSGGCLARHEWEWTERAPPGLGARAQFLGTTLSPRGHAARAQFQYLRPYRLTAQSLAQARGHPTRPPRTEVYAHALQLWASTELLLVGQNAARLGYQCHKIHSTGSIYLFIERENNQQPSIRLYPVHYTPYFTPYLILYFKVYSITHIIYSTK